MRKRFSYTPQEGDDLDQLAVRALRCGLDLEPNDRRSKWIDSHAEREILTMAYHDGQAERYESEDW